MQKSKAFAAALSRARLPTVKAKAKAMPAAAADDADSSDLSSLSSELSPPPSDFEDAAEVEIPVAKKKATKQKIKKEIKQEIKQEEREENAVPKTASSYFSSAAAAVSPKKRIKTEPTDAAEPIPEIGDLAPALIAADLSKPGKKARKAPAASGKGKGKNASTKAKPALSPPPNWEEMYAKVKEMRARVPAPVDTMGCERLAERTTSPRVKRFQTLVSLMLSSQTKDTVNAVAMEKLQTQLPGGLTLESILAVDPPRLNQLIDVVGFHRRKTEYIKKTAVILRDQHDGDIPDTIEGLIALPGVGPKMAHLCMSAAWNKTMGIGVDVHVHRITNLWGWNTTTTPEGTREALESWLPRDRWRDINGMLVGFGQTICLPRGRKCNDCLLSSNPRLCRAAFVGNSPAKRKKVVRLVKSEDEDDDEVLGKVEVKDEDEDREEEEETASWARGSPRRSTRKRVKVEYVSDGEEEEEADIEDYPGL